MDPSITVDSASELSHAQPFIAVWMSVVANPEILALETDEPTSMTHHIDMHSILAVLISPMDLSIRPNTDSLHRSVFKINDGGPVDFIVVALDVHVAEKNFNLEPDGVLIL